MSTISYDGRRFRAVVNAENGEVNADTVFHYHQQDDIVWATYEGGAVRMGTLIATVDADGNLDMRYAHVNSDGELMTGRCHSMPELLPDGRLRLHETWQWTCADRSSGKSMVKEF